MKNAWGIDIPDISDIVREDDTLEVIRSSLREITRPYNISWKKIDAVLESARNDQSPEYEERVKEAFDRLQKRWNPKIKASTLAQRKVDEINERVMSGNILDIGCGYGFVGNILAQSKGSVSGVDIVKYDGIEDLSVKYYRNVEGLPFPFKDNQFHTSLLLESLHHIADPEYALGQTSRVTRPNMRIIITEPSIGYRDYDKPQLGLGMTRKDPYNQLPSEKQLGVSVFFEGLYRIIQGDQMHCPLNMNTVKGYVKKFEGLGFHAADTVYLGHLSGEPDRRVMFVLDNKG